MGDIEWLEYRAILQGSRAAIDFFCLKYCVIGVLLRCLCLLTDQMRIYCLVYNIL